MGSEHCKCPNCSGMLEYRADYRKFGCRSCGSFFTDEQIKVMFRGKSRSDSTEKNNTDERTEQFCRGSLYVCPGCGAEIMTASGKKTDRCVYCSEIPEKKDEMPSDYLPECIIPFEITRERASEIFRENICSKRFTPSELHSEAFLEKMTGIYIPVWMADCSVSISMNGTGKAVKSWIHDVHRYTETREYATDRKADAEYTSVPSVVSGVLSSEYPEISADYDFSKLKKFDPDDLIAHPAEYCGVNKGEAFGYIREKVTGDVRSVLGKSVSDYTEFEVKNEDIDILKTSWGLGLIPVWFVSYSHGGKTFRYAVNGQNGKFLGNPPVSAAKLSLFGAAVLLAAVLLYKLASSVFGFAGSPSDSSFAVKSYVPGIVSGIIAAAVAVAVVLKRYNRTDCTESVQSSAERKRFFGLPLLLKNRFLKQSGSSETEKYAGEGETFFTARYDRYVRQYTTRVKTEET